MPRIKWILSSMAIVAALMLPVSEAGAQGTSGSLPGPIDSRQLGRYAERLGLSEPQRLAMESAHDEYRRRFRLLRDGEIAAFLKEQQSMQGGIPERAAVEGLLQKVEHLQAKIAVLDNSLFSQLVPILSEQQQAMVPRLRMARERKRYEAQATQASFGRRIVELGNLVLDLDLEPDAAVTADGIIASYERRMTTVMRKQNEAITRVTLDMMDALAERGYTDISQEQLIDDPELTKDVVGQVGEIYMDLRGRLTEYSGELRDLNQRTYEQVAAVIPSRVAYEFRNAYCRVAYPELGRVVAQARDAWMIDALALEDLSPEERDTIEAAGTMYQRQLDLLLEDGIRTVDGFWADFSPFEVNPEGGEKLRADLTELQQKAVAAKTTAESIVQQQIGEETMARIRNDAMKSRTASAPPAVAEGETAEAGDDRAFAFSGDRFLPSRISRRDIKRFTKQLQLEGDMSQVLGTLHTDYLERVSQLQVLDSLREARSAVEDDEGRATTEQIERVYELRRQAIEAMAAVDGAFFDDLGAIVGADKAALLDRVRQSRLRQSYGGSASARLALGRHNSNEASVDVVSIVLEEQPTDDELARMDDVLADYEDDAMQAFRARFEAQLELQQMADRWVAEITAAAREDIAAVIVLQTRYREAMIEPTERVARTDRAIVELNRRTLDQVLSGADAELGGSIRRAYDLAAFPSIYRDAAALDRRLTAALELDDLTTDQRERLVELGGPYRAEYEQLSRRMIEQLGTSTVNLVGLGPEAFNDWQQRQQQLVKIQFDRNELNSRAISRLRAILTDAQIHRIGGLPEPLGEDEFYFYR